MPFFVKCLIPPIVLFLFFLIWGVESEFLFIFIVFLVLEFLILFIRSLVLAQRVVKTKRHVKNRGKKDFY